MHGTYNTWLVWLSIAVAIAVSYTALNLATRVAETNASTATRWLIGGAFAMGIGMWSMHQLGMLAMRMPIALTYDIALMAGSLAIATVTSGFALHIVGRSTLSVARLLASSVVMGAGIAGMHYTGMAGVQVQPAIDYDPWLVAASIVIAITASLGALWLAFYLRRGRSWQIKLARIGAAVFMGCAIASMHYTGMAAARFHESSHSLPGAHLDNIWFGVALGMFAFGILGVTLLTSVYDAYLARHLRDRDAAVERADEQTRHAASHDPLTGLPNRRALMAAAEAAMLDAQHRGVEIALLVLNVDRLKAINDSLGHQAGDELLLELSRRIRNVLRRTDTLARLAGDEFTILATELRSARDAETVVGKVLEALRAPVKLESINLHASVSVGVSMYPLDGESFDELLKRAEIAMRYAKETARGAFRFYAADMSSFSGDHIALESELRRALELNQLELHYQPKVDISTGRVRSAEALVRWRHPERGLVPPNAFIPSAEENGLIVPIGEWVLREACRQMRRWIDAGMSPIRVAVNLSAKQFRHDDLVAVVRSALEDARLEPGYLELELTESAVMHDAEKSAATLQALSTMGVHISIDDFGTGYSSLSYLRRFPLDKLKIDRSFVRDLMSNADDVSIVRAIISLAHSLRLRVVAEGVETAEQLAFLRELGCDQYQGYLCSPAVPPDTFAKLLTHLRAERPEPSEADMLRTQSRLSAFTPII
jgi:diguanylate cyclase (GGDEF)-like protein